VIFFNVSHAEFRLNNIKNFSFSLTHLLTRPSTTLKSSIWSALFCWSAVSIILHAFYIQTPFVSMEYVFAQATQNLLSSENNLAHYWSMQANPLGYVWVSTLIHFLLGEPSGFWSYRLASLLGLVAILGAGAMVASTLKSDCRRAFHLWCALVTFSPLIWVFSGRATADVLPMGLLGLSLALVYKNEARTSGLASILFLFASIVKYHALLMAPGFIYIFWYQSQNNGEWIKRCGQFFLLPLLGFLLYLWGIYNQYGFFLVAETHSQTHKFEPANFLKTFSLYAGYLGILLGPVAWVSLLNVRKNWPGKWLILIGFGLGFGFWVDSLETMGEMNYGPFDWILNRSMLFLVKSMGAIVFGFLILDCIVEARKHKNAVAGFVLTVCIPFLLVCSASRPAQRYLIFLIPLIFYYLVFYRMQGHKIYRVVLGWGTVGIFVLANLFAVNYQVAQARAADNMAHWLIENKLIEETLPGSINTHSGQYFIPFITTQKTRTVLQGSGDIATALHAEKVVVFGRTLKTYYLN